MKFFLTTIILFIVINANAQTSQWSILVGGSLSLQRNTISFYNPQNYTLVPSTPAGSFTAAPTIGVFPLSNLLIGAQPSYSRQWVLGRPDFNNVTWSLGPVLRYYFRFGKFAVFPEGAMLYERENSIVAYNVYSPSHIEAEKVKMKSKTYGAGIGATWFVTSSVSIEAILGYKNTHTYRPAITKDQGSLYLNFGIQFYISTKE